MAENGGGMDGSGPGEGALLRAMIDSANVMTGVLELLDDDVRYVMANRAAATFYGRGESGIVGLSYRDLGVEEYVIANRLPVMRECHASGKPLVIEFPSRPLEGPDGWHLGSFSRVPSDRPLVSFVVVDITEQRRAQEIAEAQTLRLELALEATELGIWEYDVKADRVDWDERTRALFGVGPQAPIDYATYASRVHPDDFPAVRAAYEAALSGADDGRYVVEHRTSDRTGAWRWVRGAARVIFDAAGEPVRILGTTQDITEQVLARERQALLVAELNHRVKNNLATVQAIASHTLRASRGDMREFHDAFQDRLLSLARGHELLTRTNWETPHLAEALQIALEPFERAAISIAEAPVSVRLKPELAISMVMVLHELATNSAKYGALSCDGGDVLISWSVADSSVVVDWRERGGPPVKRPTRHGFGTRLKDAALRGFGGVVHSEFAPEGLRCRLVLPLGDAVVVDALRRADA